MRQSQSIALYFIIAIMVLQTMSMPLAYMNFKINREYIAETLCVNKDEPITICRGTCFLAKSIKEAHENPESEKPSQSKKQVTEILFCSVVHEFIGSNQIPNTEEKTFFYKETVTSSFPNDIFHPPKG